MPKRNLYEISLQLDLTIKSEHDESHLVDCLLTEPELRRKLSKVFSNRAYITSAMVDDISLAAGHPDPRTEEREVVLSLTLKVSDFPKDHSTQYLEEFMGEHILHDTEDLLDWSIRDAHTGEELGVKD